MINQLWVTWTFWFSNICWSRRSLKSCAVSVLTSVTKLCYKRLFWQNCHWQMAISTANKAAKQFLAKSSIFLTPLQRGFSITLGSWAYNFYSDCDRLSVAFFISTTPGTWSCKRKLLQCGKCSPEKQKVGTSSWLHAGQLPCEDTPGSLVLVLWLEKAAIRSCWTFLLTLE